MSGFILASEFGWRNATRNQGEILQCKKRLGKEIGKCYPSQRLEWIKAGLIQNSKTERPIGYQLVYPDFSHALHFSNISSDPENLTVKILDPKEYIDWKSTLFTQQESKLEKVNLIHYGNSDHIKSILKSSGLWFVSDSGRCYIRTAN